MMKGKLRCGKKKLKRQAMNVEDNKKRLSFRLAPAIKIMSIEFGN